MANFGGGKAAKKARVMAESILARTRTVYKKLGGKNLILDNLSLSFIFLQAFRTLRKLTYKSSELKKVSEETPWMSRDCRGRPCCGCQ